MDRKIQFNEEIQKGFKSPIYLNLESMIENVKKYQEDFKGHRKPKYEIQNDQLKGRLNSSRIVDGMVKKRLKRKLTTVAKHG